MTSSPTQWALDLSETSVRRPNYSSGPGLIYTSGRRLRDVYFWTGHNGLGKDVWQTSVYGHQEKSD